MYKMPRTRGMRNTLSRSSLNLIKNFAVAAQGSRGGEREEKEKSVMGWSLYLRTSGNRQSWLWDVEGSFFCGIGR